MTELNLPEKRKTSLTNRFATATWIALALALVGLALDGHAIFQLPHRSLRGSHRDTHFVVLWAVEIAIALLALWLLRFAFSRSPRLVANP